VDCCLGDPPPEDPPCSGRNNKPFREIADCVAIWGGTEWQETYHSGREKGPRISLQYLLTFSIENPPTVYLPQWQHCLPKARPGRTKELRGQESDIDKGGKTHLVRHTRAIVCYLYG
jgi:hypothetical protein